MFTGPAPDVVSVHSEGKVFFFPAQANGSSQAAEGLRVSRFSSIFFGCYVKAGLAEFQNCSRMGSSFDRTNLPKIPRVRAVWNFR